MSIRVCPLCQAEFLDYKVACSHCGVALVDPTDDVDFKLLEEDEQVEYDLSEWPIDARTDTAELFAESGLPHAWNGTDLVVPEVHEESADRLLERIEEHYGLASDGSDADDDADDVGDDDGDTEFDLEDWDTNRRIELVEKLVDAGIPHRWEGNLLIVPTKSDTRVDSILDEMDGLAPGDGEGRGSRSSADPFAILQSLFLAAERMRKGKVSADDYESLLEALDDAEPNQPPYGVERSLWEEALECGEDLADAVADESDELEGVADRLHGLLRNFV